MQAPVHVEHSNTPSTYIAPDYDCSLPVCFVKPQVHLLQTHMHTLFFSAYNSSKIIAAIKSLPLTATRHHLCNIYVACLILQYNI